MNSHLYECQIMHERIVPKRYGFTHNIFMFYVDLDEVESLAKRLRWFGSERFNLFSFYEQDHLKFAGKNLKQSILEFLSKRGVELEGGRIMLLTHLRTLGHVFNPVSFYFCFDRAGNPKCVVAEVGNTFGEIKPYFLGADCWQENSLLMGQCEKTSQRLIYCTKTFSNRQLQHPRNPNNLKLSNNFQQWAKQKYP